MPPSNTTNDNTTDGLHKKKTINKLYTIFMPMLIIRIM